MAAVQDKGFAWIVCICCFMNLLVVGGFIYTTGIFYLLFKNGLNAGDTELSLITSLNVAVTHAVCPFAGMLIERYGARCVSMIGTMLVTVGLVSSSFCTKVYQLYIFYGVLSGVGMGMILNPSITIIDKYFMKYKRIACGLALCGVGFGSFIYPAILNAFEDAYGWRGAIVLIAGVSAHTLVFSSFFKPIRHDGGKRSKVYLQRNSERVEILKVRAADICDELIIVKSTAQSIAITSPMTNYSIHSQDHDFQSSPTSEEMQNTTEHSYVLPHDCTIDKPKKEIRQNSGNWFLDVISLFKIVNYSCTLACSLTIIFPVAIVYTHFGSYVLTLGHSSMDVVLLYMTMGLCSTIGRPLAGIIAQILHMNSPAFIMCSTMMIGILTILLPLSNQRWLMYVYAAFFQLLLSPYNILVNSIPMESLPKSKVAFGVGLSLTATVPGFLGGPPIAAWVYNATMLYSSAFYMAGAIFILAGLTMAPAAYHISKSSRQ